MGRLGQEVAVEQVGSARPMHSGMEERVDLFYLYLAAGRVMNEIGRAQGAVENAKLVKYTAMQIRRTYRESMAVAVAVVDKARQFHWCISNLVHTYKR